MLIPNKNSINPPIIIKLTKKKYLMMFSFLYFKRRYIIKAPNTAITINIRALKSPISGSKPPCPSGMKAVEKVKKPEFMPRNDSPKAIAIVITSGNNLFLVFTVISDAN
jgi:hypothetical protein